MFTGLVLLHILCFNFTYCFRLQDFTVDGDLIISNKDGAIK